MPPPFGWTEGGFSGGLEGDYSNSNFTFPRMSVEELPM